MRQKRATAKDWNGANSAYVWSLLAMADLGMGL